MELLLGALAVIAAASVAYSVHLRSELAHSAQSIEEAAAERKRFEEYLEIAGAMIVVLEPSGHIRSLNQKSLDVLETRLDEVRGQDWYATFVPAETRGSIRAHFLSLMSGAEGEEGYAEYAITTTSGRCRHTVWYRRVLRDESGTVTGLLSVGFDDTDRKCLEEELATRALYDELTGLYNRWGFNEVAQRVLALAQRTGREVRVFYADVDNLKDINDTYGHPAGDAALVVAAQCLQDVFRSADLLARIGGDEFAALTLSQDEDDDEALLLHVRERIESACDDDQLPSHITMSLGVAYVDLGSPDALEAALALADQSMYANKQTAVTEEDTRVLGKVQGGVDPQPPLADPTIP